MPITTMVSILPSAGFRFTASTPPERWSRQRPAMSPAGFLASCSNKRIRPYEGKSKRVRVSGLHPLLLPISAEFFATLQQLELGSSAPSPWRPWLEGSDGLRHDLPEAAMARPRSRMTGCGRNGMRRREPGGGEKTVTAGRVDGKWVRKQ
jgi:hypothetical protein